MTSWRERFATSRYLDRLGLISVIRQDFERLKTLLADWLTHGADGARPAPDTHDGPDPRPVERIILYIDDLDRCPPERVVEVLQAVHLILAFDLFVVVVAVDARWLERSLNEAYNPWMKAEGAAPREPVHPFDAHNYLEKIFQIPFSLPAMGQSGYQKLVARMLGTPREEAERRRAEREDARRKMLEQEERRRRAQGEEPPPAEHRKEALQAPRPGASTQARAGPEDAEERAKKQKAEEDEHAKREEDRRRHEREEQQKRDQEEAEKRVAAMLLGEKEEQFIAALFPFIETPRLAKRFVNIYRLLRVRAATREGIPFSRFIHPEGGEYRAALMLLAISVGQADVASEILNGLYDANQGSFRDWLKAQSESFDGERMQLIGKREARDQETGARGAPTCLETQRRAEFHDASISIHAKVDQVIGTLKELKGPAFDDRLDVYRRWAHEVGRYSFDWR